MLAVERHLLTIFSVIIHVEAAGRIMGGSRTTIEENPWQVQIFVKELNDTGHNLCGGALFRTSESKYKRQSNLVLTASHCVMHENTKIPAENIKVFSGSNILIEGKLSTVKYVIPHKYYSYAEFDQNPEDMAHDIALLILSEPLKYSNTVRAIELPRNEALKHPPSTRGLCKISGFGSLNSDGNSTSQSLMEVALPYITPEKCRKITKQWIGIIEDGFVFCAGFEKGNKDSCKGDSGGPYVCKNSKGNYRIFGIISHGFNETCGMAKSPGIYTNILKYRKWLNKTLQKIDL